MKRILRMLLSRTAFVLILLLLQIVLFLVVIEYFSQFAYVNTIFYGISILIVLYLVSSDGDPNYKLSWIIPILLFPLFGGIFYLFYRQRNVSKKVIQEHLQIDQNRKQFISTEMVSETRTAHYLNTLFWPSYDQTQTEFLSSGEIMFDKLKKDLKLAKSFILIEYFIIKKGQMWDELYSILKEKASEGLDVKLIFDDFGSSELPINFLKKLKNYGIDVQVFNKMKLHLNFGMNYRDHRKIVVIDGKIGYIGSMNIGDEYINLKSPFGHWLDIGLRLEGSAVWSLTLGFLENYRFTHKKDIDYLKYKVNHETDNDGIVIPFTDTPLDHNVTSKLTYLQMIHGATKFIYITTPYLIIDNEISNALKLASISGVDVRIIIPYIPDKRIVYMVTESYVPELIKYGIKVYKYKPGFIHAKLMVTDNEKAMIGTVNFDYRSFYLHFENSVYLEDTSSIHQMTSFFLQTVEKCVDFEDLKRPNIFYKVLQQFFKGFSSLL